MLNHKAKLVENTPQVQSSKAKIQMTAPPNGKHENLMAFTMALAKDQSKSISGLDNQFDTYTKH